MQHFLDLDGAPMIEAVRRTDDARYPEASRVPYTGRPLAGVAVNPDTAVTVAAVWACIRFVSQTVGVLPWRVMRTGERGGEVAEKHPVDWLLHKRPSDEWSSFQFRETLAHWALRWGNGYAEIERDTVGRPLALWPLHPERVEVCRDPEDGKLYYEVNNGSGSAPAQLDPNDVFHLRGFGEGPVGVNVITYAAESLSWARAVQLHGASFFGNGMNISGVVTSKSKFEPEPLKRLKTEMDKLYRGPRNANRVAYLDNDMDWKAISIDPEKGQMIETHYLLVEEVCRWFGVPPHKVAHLLRATFSNIEHQAIEVVQDCILPWAKRFEDEADYKLFGANRPGMYTKINLRGLLRGDFKSQQEGLEIMRHNGVISADDWRDFTDMNAMPKGVGGDKYTMQSQYTTLEQVGVVPDTKTAAQDDITEMAETADAAADA